MTHAIFVYGSLRSGERNHGVLGGALCIGDARTEPRFTLHDLGAFPGLVAGGASHVHGDVYAVDAGTLAALDRLEGHPRYYRRAPIRLEDGREVETYLLTARQVVGCPIVESGDWRAYRRERGR
ncbi:MAG: gamma-glutamylcyclotransferase [Polyangiales bacterium]